MSKDVLEMCSRASNNVNGFATVMIYCSLFIYLTPWYHELSNVKKYNFLI